MTSRERISETLNHREPDMLAIDLGGMRSTGISAIAYTRLKNYLKTKNGCTRLYDVFQQLAEPEMDIVNLMGGDVSQLHRLSPVFDIPINRWKQGKLPDGSSCIVPEKYDSKRNEKDELEITVGSKVIARMPKDGLYFDVVDHPYENAQSYDDIDKIPISEITDEELAFLKENAQRLYDTTDKAILGAFGGSIFETGQLGWGYETFFINLAINKDLIHYWLNKLTEAYMRDLVKYLDAVGEYINVIQFGDDFGTQNSLQISKQMYVEMIKPYHEKLYGFVRSKYPHIKVFLHSCGAIFDLIPELINAGVEILNPVQVSAKGMNPIKLKKEYGAYLTFWGGGADMQNTVNSGTIGQIKEEVKELINIFSPGGGYVFSQIHNIQPNISPEKILAIYDTALKYRTNV